MSSAALSRIRRRPRGAPPVQLALPPVPQARFGRRELLLVLVTVAGLFVLFSGSALIPQHARGDELAEIQDDPKPPEPKVQPQPPQPPPPPEVPKDITPPPSDPNPPPVPQNDPPPPQFGMPDGSTADNGSFAVATGNTVMKKAEEFVKAAGPPSGMPGGPYALTRPPDELAPVLPAYPAWAEERGVTATVMVRVVIDTVGKVVDMAVLRSGGGDFDRAVRRALAAARYRPYVKDGRTMPAVFERRFDFLLE